LIEIKAATPHQSSTLQKVGAMASKLTLGDLQVVTRIPVFRGLRSETVEHIIAPATASMLRPREWVVRQEAPATAFFIVIDGWVKLYRSTPSGEEAVINIIKKGDSFGEAAALTGNRYIASAEAVSDARVARIPADHIVRCIRENPDLALAMIASTSQRLETMIQQIEQLKAQSGVQRVAEFLASLSAVERGACAIRLPYDKVLIASRLGLTPEYLSRAFARLRNLGVSVNASRVVVQDVAKLRQLADEDRCVVRGSL
jgi:CRP-like cAMP-binding protein